MPRASELQVVPDDVELGCYRCKSRGGSTPATHFKWMGTPSGGEYRRGWCRACLAELGIAPPRGEWGARDERRPTNADARPKTDEGALRLLGRLQNAYQDMCAARALYRERLREYIEYLEGEHGEAPGMLEKVLAWHVAESRSAPPIEEVAT